MLTFESDVKKIRFWINERPDIPKYSGVSVSAEIIVQTHKSMNKMDMSVEFLLPWHSSNYALLCMEYFPDNTGVLKVNVNGFKVNKVKLKNRLSHIGDEISLGICSDYAEEILNYVSRHEKVNEIPSGELTFYSGAYSKIGSSLMAYLTAVEMLLKLLVLDNYSLESLEVEALLDESLFECRKRYNALKE